MATKPPQEQQKLEIPQRWRALIWSLPLLLIALFWLVQLGSDRQKIPYTAFKQELREGNVQAITVEGQRIRGALKGALGVTPQDRGTGVDAVQRKFVTTMPSFEDPDLMGLLERQGVTLRAETTGVSWGQMCSMRRHCGPAASTVR